MMQNIKRFKVYFEVFNPDEAYGISKYEVDLLAERYEKTFESNTDKRFINWVRDNPGLMTGFLSERTKINFDYMILKVFPKHLNFKKIEALLKDSQQTRAIVIQRNAIDSFISLVKSISAGCYHSCDTSALQVALSANYFKKWYIQSYNWYRAIESMLKFYQVPTSVFNYEDDICVTEETLKNTIKNKLSDIGVDIVFKDGVKNVGLQKQDKEKQYDLKCNNWNEFVRELECYDLQSKAFSHI